MNDFRLIKLGDVAKFRNGLNFQKSSNGQKIKIVGVSDFKNRLTPNYEELEEIQVDGTLHIEDYLHYGDIVFVRSNGNKALVARSLFIDKNEKLSFSGFCIKARIIDEEILLRKYFLYFTKTRQFKYAISKGAIGTNINNLNQGILYDLIVPTPNINTQQLIVKLLSDLDSKIKLNNKINAELEGMAKLIYEYWFVQFDFPFDFAQGKPADDSSDPKDVKPYKSSGGKMVWNKELKREIPEGWEVGTLLNIAIFNNGIACQKYRPGQDEEKYRVIKIREMNNGFSESTEFVKTEIPDTAIINNGDVLFSWSATLDVKIWSEGIGALNQHIFKVTSTDYPRTYYYFELLIYLEHFKMMANLRKTTMGHITQDHLKQSRIVIPDKILIKNIHKKINPIFDRIVKNQEENQQLSSLRDWLLPMLMNGQLKIK